MHKRKLVMSATVVVLAAALSVSCESISEPGARGAANLTSYIKEETVPFGGAAADEAPSMRISLNLPDLSGGGALQGLIQDLLYKGLSPEAYGEALIADYKIQYRSMEKDYRAYSDMPSESMNWEYAETWEAAVNSPGLLVLNREKEYYFGGAHGMREKEWIVIDRKKNRQVLPSDLFPAEKLPLLRAAIEDALRERAGLVKGEKLSKGGYLEDSAEITDNFYLSSAGAGFHWDPYDIAAYVVGPVDVIIPYGKIQNLLNSAGRALAMEAEKAK
jgi:hypothetical protein